MTHVRGTFVQDAKPFIMKILAMSLARFLFGKIKFFCANEPYILALDTGHCPLAF
jgi:hypothetical protein